MPKENHNKRYAVSLLQIFQAFSLDVVVGSLAMGVFAVTVLHVTVNGWWWPVLALSVWVVYTGDHLIDGFHQKQAATMFRHRIHYRYRYFFFAALFLAAITAVVLVWLFMDRRILTGGILLAMGALVYLGLIYFGRKIAFYFQKEFFISFFYVAGIWLAPVIWYGKPLSYSSMASMAILFLLAWAEGLMMAYFEYKFDKGDRTQSFCTFYGLATTRKLSAVLMMLAILLSFVLVFSTPALEKEFILLVVLSAILMLLFVFPSFFQKNGRYRILGELSFWLPFVLLI
jgi:hypothetical protein